MKTMKVAIFGHYDSRGGTMAFEIPEFTEAAVHAAVTRYNKDAFGIEEAKDLIQTTAYGMPARRCDQLVHALIHGDTTPGEEDFMYVADFYYPDDADLTGDLARGFNCNTHEEVVNEECQSDLHGKTECVKGGDVYDWRTQHRYCPLTRTVYDSDEWDVVISNGADWDYGELPEKDMDGEAYQGDWTLKHKIEHSIANPRQLELVRLPKGWREKIAEVEPIAGEELWNTRDRLEEEEEKAVASYVQLIENPVATRWDDDAYGFMFLPEGGW